MALSPRRNIQLDAGAAAEGPRTPPTEFRIFGYGPVDTLKGMFVFDDVAAAMLMQTYQMHGNDLCFDYEHQAVQPEPMAAPAAGWFNLELRQDGLYAVNCRWTEKAGAHLAAGEYRYCSPAFDYDMQSMRIVNLINIALTNIPATKNMQPLVAARAVPFKTGPMVEGKWDQQAAVGRMREHCKAANGQMDMGKYAEGFALVDGPEDKLSSYKLPHHDVQNGQLVVHKQGVMKACHASMRLDLGEHGDSVRDHLRAHCKDMGVTPPFDADGDHDNDGGEQDHAATSQTTNPTTPQDGDQTMNKALLKMLNLPESASEADVAAELAKRNAQTEKTERELLSITGAKTIDEAVGTARAWKDGAGALQTSQQELAALKAKQIDVEIDAEIAKAEAERKVVPTEKEHLHAMGKAVGLTQFKAYLAAKPQVVASPSVQVPAIPAVQQETGTVTLTDAEKANLFTMGVNVDSKDEKTKRIVAKYLETKQRYAGRNQADIGEELQAKQSADRQRNRAG